MQQVHMREDKHGSDNVEKLICTLREQEKRDLSVMKKQNMSEGVRVSKLEGLGLAEYVLAKKSNCELYHKDCRKGCEQMVYAGKIVLEESYVALPTMEAEACIPARTIRL